MYNSYFGNQYYPNYPQGYQGFTQSRPAQPQTQSQPQNIIQPEEKPFNDVRFVTKEEAMGFIMFPNTKVMLIDRDNSVFYIKSADSIGKSTIEAYKFVRAEDNPTEVASPQIDTKDFVKMADLKGFITREEMSNFITREELGNLLKGGSENGRQQPSTNNTIPQENC